MNHPEVRINTYLSHEDVLKGGRVGDRCASVPWEGLEPERLRNATQPVANLLDIRRRLWII